ncbi:MAG: cytochrome c oxidase subunit II [Myxococcota bacterium]
MSALLEWVEGVYRKLLFLPDPASAQARAIDHLHFLIISVTTGAAVLIALVCASFVVRYRRRPGDPLGPTERVVAPRALEVLTYGAILASFIGFWVIGVGQYLALGRPPEDALEIYVTGKQWMWKFAYPNGAASAGVLYVPAGRPVRLLLTSRDVIHSFFLPDFRMKRDAVPGRYTGLWFVAEEPGRHPVLCAEMCGTGHSQMDAELVVMEPHAFAAWLSGGGRPAGAGEPDLVSRGRRAARAHGCLQCHSFDGSPGIGPTWRGAFDSEVLLKSGDRVRFDEAYLTRSMMDPRAELVAGFEPVMPSYRGQIDPDETAAIVELIKSLARGGSAARPAEEER